MSLVDTRSVLLLSSILSSNLDGDSFKNIFSFFATVISGFSVIIVFLCGRFTISFFFTEVVFLEEKFESNQFDVTKDTQIEIDAKDAGMNVSAVQSYTIDWVGGTREKLRGNLPAYPPGVNKTAVIMLRFKVFPDGTVGEILPLQKGDTVLENAAINMLKEWQFNALEENAPKEMQEGKITFIYRLE